MEGTLNICLLPVRFCSNCLPRHWASACLDSVAIASIDHEDGKSSGFALEIGEITIAKSLYWLLGTSVQKRSGKVLIQFKRKER